jgi:hypothetical protein
MNGDEISAIHISLIHVSAVFQQQRPYVCILAHDQRARRLIISNAYVSTRCDQSSDNSGANNTDRFITLLHIHNNDK